MAKVIRLTEQDFVRLVNRVIKEQESKPLTKGSTGSATINPGGNRPGSFEFVVLRDLGGKKYDVKITKWEFGNYGKVGDVAKLQVGPKDTGKLEINKTVLDNISLDPGVFQQIQNVVTTVADKVMGKTGNKFWDAAKNSLKNKMQNGNIPNTKMWCYDESCENNIVIFSDGRAVFEQAEFDKKTNGKMIFYSDGSFIFKWDDGGTSKRYYPKK